MAKKLKIILLIAMMLGGIGAFGQENTSDVVLDSITFPCGNYYDDIENYRAMGFDVDTNKNIAMNKAFINAKKEIYYIYMMPYYHGSSYYTRDNSGNYTFISFDFLICKTIATMAAISEDIAKAIGLPTNIFTECSITKFNGEKYEAYCTISVSKEYSGTDTAQINVFFLNLTMNYPNTQ